MIVNIATPADNHLIVGPIRLDGPTPRQNVIAFANSINHEALLESAAAWLVESRKTGGEPSIAGSRHRQGELTPLNTKIMQVAKCGGLS